MNINPSFLNGSLFWRNLIDTNAQRAATVMSDPAFLKKVREWPKFDFTELTPQQVGDLIENAGTVNIRVGFYWNWFSRAIASEADGQVSFNTAKSRYGAGNPGNIAHETMHALGESHNGNSAVGNENTVPYRIGQWVDEWVS